MTRDDAPNTDDPDTAPRHTTAMEGAIGVARDLIGEVAAVVPRLADRTAAQIDLTRSLAARMPCIGSWLGASPSQSTTGPGNAGGGGPGADSRDSDDQPVGRSPTTPTGTVLSALAQRPGRSEAATSAPPDASATAPDADTGVGDNSNDDPSGFGAAPAVGELAIPGYDSLAASQVVPRLTTLSTPELDAIGAYEASHRGRRTILNRVTQLRAD